MDISYYLRQIANNGNLSKVEAEELFGRFLTNEAEESKSDSTSGLQGVHGLQQETADLFDSELASAYLYSTTLRSIQPDEFVGAAKVLRRKMIAVPTRECIGDVDLLDTCGTGGSGLNPFNTSTAVAFVTAAAGVYTAKHGNRAASSQSGSADVLQALGVNITSSPEQFLNCLTRTKFGFLFAPHHHPAARKVAPLRKKLGVRTIFNFLGPILNPAGANLQLLGVSDPKMQLVMAESLLELGTKRALVVRGEDGLDEVTLGSRTLVCEIADGKLTTYEIAPEDFALSRSTAKDTVGGPAADSARMIWDIFQGARGPRSDLVYLNAGAALYVAGKSSSIAEGIGLARSLIESGAAAEVLRRVIIESNA